MVLANDFSGDEKSDPGTSQSKKSRLQQPSIQTDFDQSAILASSYGDSETYTDTLHGTVCWDDDEPSIDDTYRG